VINDSPLKKALNEFLRRACEIAKGDTDRSISIYKIWDDNFPIRSLSRDDTLPIVLRSLKEPDYNKDKDQLEENQEEETGERETTNQVF
jgi:hypothetical protein